MTEDEIEARDACHAAALHFRWHRERLLTASRRWEKCRHLQGVLAWVDRAKWWRDQKPRKK